MNGSAAGGNGWILAIWKRLLDLSWPIMAEQVLRTLMRTTDVIIAGFFSPAAVAAVGLADIYARLPLRFGLSIGDATIALASQDTGSGALANRDQAFTQAVLIGLLTAVPFMLFGAALNEWAIRVLGAESDVVRVGATYLAIIMISSPAVHVNYITAKAIQATGDTRTPMYINAGANGVNIPMTIAFAFGLGPLPELSVVGIALATAIADVAGAAAFFAVIRSRTLSDLGFVRPTDLVIAKQIVVITIPRVSEGLTELVAEFPFNAILLAFGTEVNAAYHIGRRMYNQIAAPLSRGFSVGTSILVGQAMGRGDRRRAYRVGWASAGLSVLTVGGLGLVAFVAAEWFALVFTRDPPTLEHAANFARAFGLGAFLIALYISISGALRGGSETRPPFVARLTGTFFFLLGITYVFGVRLEYGVVAAYAAIIADYAWRNVVVCAVYYRKNWLDRGTSMMGDRESYAPSDDEPMPGDRDAERVDDRDGVDVSED